MLGLELLVLEGEKLMVLQGLVLELELELPGVQKLEWLELQEIRLEERLE